MSNIRRTAYLLGLLTAWAILVAAIGGKPTHAGDPPTATPTPTPCIQGPNEDCPPMPTATPTNTPTSTPTNTPTSTPTPLWVARHEAGNLNEWTAGGMGPTGGSIDLTGNGRAYATQARAHGGTWSAGLVITTTQRGQPHAVRMTREKEDHHNNDLYYSTWYYIPSGITSPWWWNVWQWKSRYHPDATQHGMIPNFVAGVYNAQGGGLRFLFHYYCNHTPLTQCTGSPVSGPAVPTGQWFHMEGWIHKATNNTGHVKMWLDGTQVLDLPNVMTDWGGSYGFISHQWTVNNYADDLNGNQPTTIWIDDGIISGHRIGP